MWIHLIPKPFDYTTIAPVFGRDVHCQGSHCNANLQVQHILNNTFGNIKFPSKENKTNWQKQTTEKDKFKGLLYDTCVLTFGGPLWNFFSKVCIKKTIKIKSYKVLFLLKHLCGHGLESINQTILPRACDETGGYTPPF